MPVMDMTTEAPACPSACTNTEYPLSLEQDLFKPQGLQDTWMTTAFESAKLALKSSAILISFPVDEAFKNYTGGIYSSLQGDPLFYHVTLAVHAQDDYIVGINSWGSAWGEVVSVMGFNIPGTFRIRKEVIRDYVIPGKIVSETSRSDTLPTWMLASVTLDGFANATFNGEYVENGVLINDHPTLMIGLKKESSRRGARQTINAMRNPKYKDSPTLYYCKYWSRWIVALAAQAELARESDNCPGYGRSPPIAASLTLRELQTDLDSLAGWIVDDEASGRYQLEANARVLSIDPATFVAGVPSQGRQ